MKRTITVLAWCLFALLLLDPVGVLLCASFGYRFRLVSYNAFAVLIAAIGISATLLCGTTERFRLSTSARILYTLAAPLSVVNTLFFVQASHSLLTAILCAVGVVACCCQAYWNGVKKPYKAVAVSSAVLMMLPVAALSGFFLLFGSFGEKTVYRSVTSPDGSAYVQIVDDNQGALGGAMTVEAYTKQPIDAVVFQALPKPQVICSGRWGEFSSMELSWINNEELEINGKAYRIRP